MLTEKGRAKLQWHHMSVVGYKTPVTRLFVQNNVQDNNIESIKATLMALCRRWIPAT